MQSTAPKGNGVYLGLDLSVTGAGICVIDTRPEAKQPFYIERAGYPLSADSSFEDVHRRIETINAAVVRMLMAHKPGIVGIEDIVFANEGNAKAQIWGLNILVQHTVFKFDLPCVMVPLDTWRAYLKVSWQTMQKEHPGVTKGERSKLLKNLVRERIREKWGVFFPPEQHNEAEAYAIARFVQYRTENPLIRTEELFPAFKPKKQRKGRQRGQSGAGSRTQRSLIG